MLEQTTMISLDKICMHELPYLHGPPFHAAIRIWRIENNIKKKSLLTII